MDMRSFSFRLLPSAGQVDETDTDLSFAGQDREERGRGAFRDAQAPPHLGGGSRALSLQYNEDVVIDLRPTTLQDSPPPFPGGVRSRTDSPPAAPCSRRTAARPPSSPCSRTT